MSFEEAVNLLDQVTANAVASRKDHQMMLEALKVIRDFYKKMSPPKDLPGQVRPA